MCSIGTEESEDFLGELCLASRGRSWPCTLCGIPRLLCMCSFRYSRQTSGSKEMRALQKVNSWPEGENLSESLGTGVLDVEDSIELEDSSSFRSPAYKLRSFFKRSMSRRRICRSTVSYAERASASFSSANEQMSWDLSRIFSKCDLHVAALNSDVKQEWSSNDRWRVSKNCFHVALSSTLASYHEHKSH